MATWNERYYKGKDVYSDGEIEDSIYEYVKQKDYMDKLDEMIGNEYTLAYHLSPIRENILNWYPFQKAESAIEIGAGCGAITGVLCRRLGEVVSVDLSKKRSAINYERHKKYENLQVMIGNFNDIELEHQYDYVILNGVFEYALSFTKTEQPYEDFLRNISKFLKPEGKFLIAIENKLGLKYFNGAKEDHTGNYFLGLNGYEGNETVRTFTKTELSDVLNEVGFCFTRYYYPYPDYKFPNEIFTDETLVPNQYGRPIINIEDDRYVLFNENTVNEFLLKEQIRDVLANSFLVEASRKQFAPLVSYAKLNMERNKQFRIGTVIKRVRGKKEVVKFPLDNSACEHILNIYDTILKTEGKRVFYLQAEKRGNEIVFPFLSEENLDKVLNKYMQEKNREQIIFNLEHFYEVYLHEFNDKKRTSEYNTEEFVTLFGNEKREKLYLCVKGANIDIILDNVYEKDGRYILIDGEWIYFGWIPYVFLIWRSINELYSKHAAFNELIPRKNLMEHFGIEEEDEKLFWAWAEYFAEQYVGSGQRACWAKKMKSISLDEIHQNEKKRTSSTMSLYIDYGEGFSEEGKQYQDVKLHAGEFEVIFFLENIREIKKLRFDPVEGMICRCVIDEISEGFYFTGNNSNYTKEGQELFIHPDPQYYIRLDGTSQSLTIRGYLYFLNEEEIETGFISANKQSVEMENKIQQMELDFSQSLELLKRDFEAERQKKVVELEQLIVEKEQLVAMKEQLIAEREYYKKENEKNAYLANNTRAFLRRKLRQKFGKRRCE